MARRLLVSLALATISLLAPVTGLYANPRVTAPQASLSFRFDLHKGFMLIPGAVDGHRGHFMLDSGSPFEFLLNRESVHLPPGKPISSGSAASGQAVTILKHPGKRAVQLGTRSYARKDMLSGNFGFVEKELGEPFLGFVGVGFFGAKTMTIDYRHRLVTVDQPAAKTIGTPIAVLRFALRDGVPEIPLEVGGIAVTGRIDTGSQGFAVLTPATRARLLKSGSLSQTSKRSSGDLENVCYGQTCFSIPDLDVDVGESDQITLGSSFLRQYRSVWRYSQHTIELLQP